MPTIHILPQELIAQIAAGEVIERPSFAVKELLENALDALATHLIIELQDAGIKEIKITDNGEGIGKKDLLLALHPHATSKLTDTTSLHSIKTLGFRGEALSSIASISHLTLRSRKKGESSGWMIESEYGTLKEITPTGMPEGTQLIVKNLFHTIPARKKFLRSIASELRLIVEMISSYAVCFPQKRFFLSHNGKTLLDLSPSSYEERVENVIGKKVFSQTFSFIFEDSYIKGQGRLGKPQIATTTSKEYLFINNRLVQDKLILASIKEAYRTLIEKTQFPFYILHLSIPPEMIDVNIHPRKEHLAFHDPVSLYSILEKEVKTELANQNLTFSSLTWKTDGKNQIITKSSTGQELKEEVFLEREDVLGESLSDSIIQLHRVFLVTQTKQGILLIDQHAAHERVLYEKFKKRLEARKKEKKTTLLSTPISLEMSLSEFHLFEEAREIIKEVGYGIEEFHEKTLLITSVPTFFLEFNHEDTIHEILDQIREVGVASKDKQIESMLCFLSCKAAIKAGDFLSDIQMKDLLTQLENSPNNATCPHGRPTKILLSLQELYRLFKRK